MILFVDVAAERMSGRVVEHADVLLGLVIGDHSARLDRVRNGGPVGPRASLICEDAEREYGTCR